MFLRPCSGEIEQALQRVKDKTGERWPIPFVLDRILCGEAGAFEFVDSGEVLARMVVELLVGHEVVMNVWVLEGSPGIQWREEMVRLIDDLARSVGASHWKLESPRKGWARVLRGYVTSTRTVYERKVP